MRPITWFMIVTLFWGGYWLADGRRPWLALLGFVFVAFPYHLMATGAHTLKFLTPRATDRQKLLCIMLFNTACLVLFASFATPPVALWVAGMIVLALLCQLYLSRYPVADITSEGLVAVMPFMLGVLLGESSRLAALMPLAVVLVLWAIASHIVWQLAEHSEQVTVRLTSFVSKVGNEIAIMAIVGTYSVAVVLPLWYYGTHGVLLSLLFVLYAVRASALLPVRFHARNMRYVRTWWLVRRINYLTLGIVLLYAAANLV